MLQKGLWAFGILLAISGCAGSGSGSNINPNLIYSVDLTSQSTNLKTLDGGTKVAGWNRLTGSTTIQGETAEVEMLGNVSYTNGTGPFFGFLTVTLPDSSTLTMRMDGQATRHGSGDTTFSCSLEALGGTGTYSNATGRGRFTGIRQTALGGLVQIDVEAAVRSIAP